MKDTEHLNIEQIREILEDGSKEVEATVKLRRSEDGMIMYVQACGGAWAGVNLQYVGRRGGNVNRTFGNWARECFEGRHQ